MLLRVVIVLAGATVLALLFACQGYVMYLRQGNALPFSTLFAMALVDWWAWAAFLPGLAWLTGRLPVPRSRWLRWTLLLLLVGAAVAAAKMLVNSLLRAAARRDAAGAGARTSPAAARASGRLTARPARAPVRPGSASGGGRPGARLGACHLAARSSS